uniref:S-adenosyl-L-methionine-dependent methyltransferase superfamily protein n=1 Tax=Zea mays TaxID=4577 RepID=A0A804RGX9_MAIZE
MNFMRSLLNKFSFLDKTSHIYKEISFLSPTYDHIFPKRVSVVARLSCSSNMLEGDTGCSIWPSSLFLSEFVLSYPKIFSTKCCFELGSGVGLVGICLNHVGASKVILTDGDPCTLRNMKENMELNNLCIEQEDSRALKESKNKVECKYLSWEEVSESDLWGYQPDVVLGADIIYDPVCVPHLVRVLSMLLRRDGRQGGTNGTSVDEFVYETEAPVAYIATVVRNPETFDCFATAAADTGLSVLNITSSTAPSRFLPYMLSYDRSSVQLLRISLLS